MFYQSHFRVALLGLPEAPSTPLFSVAATLDAGSSMVSGSLDAALLRESSSPWSFSSSTESSSAV